MIQRQQGWCSYCQRWVLGVRENRAVYLALLPCFPLAILLALVSLLTRGPYLCTSCGSPLARRP